MDVEMEQRNVCLLGVERLYYFASLLILAVADATLALDEAVDCLVEGRVLQLGPY